MKFLTQGIIITIIISFFISSNTVFADEEEHIEIIETEVVSDTELVPAVEMLPETVETNLSFTEPNHITAYAFNYLIAAINNAASEQAIIINYNDDYEQEINDYLDTIILSDIENPALYRDIFINLVLLYIGVDQDSIYYDFFYEIVGQFYDEVTGLSVQKSVYDDEGAFYVTVLGMLGSVSVLGFVKWMV